MTPDALVAAGLIKNTKIDIKILASGDLTKSLTVTAHGFSKTAKEKIEAAGGTVTWLRGEPVAKKPKKAKAKRPEAVEEVASKTWRSRSPRRHPRLRPTRQLLSNAELARKRLARP